MQFCKKKCVKNGKTIDSMQEYHYWIRIICIARRRQISRCTAPGAVLLILIIMITYRLDNGLVNKHLMIHNTQYLKILQDLLWQQHYDKIIMTMMIIMMMMMMRMMLMIVMMMMMMTWVAHGDIRKQETAPTYVPPHSSYHWTTSCFSSSAKYDHDDHTIIMIIWWGKFIIIMWSRWW